MLPSLLLLLLLLLVHRVAADCSCISVDETVVRCPRL
jgi:hypothetical protein